MAVDQQTYFNAIGRAGLVFSDAVLANINSEKAGCVPCWDSALSQCNQIECAEFFYRNGDYAVSDDSAHFYEAMLIIASSKYSTATPDPNVKLPLMTIVVQGGTVPPIEFVIPAGTTIPFTYGYTAPGQPDVSFYISNGSGGLTTNGATNITNNIIGGIMYIYGNDNGFGEFNEDTYVRITP